MNRRHMYLLAALAAILALGRQAPAADDSEARIQALERQLEAISNELAEIKAQHSAAPVATPPPEAAAEPAGGPVPSPLPEWIERIKVFGDFRYRHEYTDDETQTVERNRDRIQLHLGLTAARTNTPTGVTTDYDTVLLDVIARF
jgi:hypothetical protein